MFVKRLWAPTLLSSALALSLGFLVGCGGDSGSTTKTTTTSSTKTDAGGSSSSGGSASSGEKTPLKPDGFATLKGKVTFAGNPPEQKKIVIDPKVGDKAYCEKGDTNDPSLIVGADKGVANVVVWVRPPKDKFFEIPADHQKPAQALVKVDQPFCAFEPHVSVIFPSFYDETTKKQKPTGQKFEVANSAKISHNTNWTPGDSRINQGGNQILKEGSDLPIDLKAAQEKKAGQEDKISLKCNIHQWMTGYVWAFDHPYAAISKPDGSFELTVPAGSPLELVAWQEKYEFVLPEGKGDRNGQKLDALKSGETKTVDFKIGQ